RPAGSCAGRDHSLMAICWGLPPPRSDDRGSLSVSVSVCLRSLLDRLANANVSPTAANVAGQRVIDFSVRRMRVAGEERRSRHDLAGLAVAALNDLPVEPGLLDLGARGCPVDGLDRGDLGVADAVDG